MVVMVVSGGHRASVAHGMNRVSCQTHGGSRLDDGDGSRYAAHSELRRLSIGGMSNHVTPHHMNRGGQRRRGEMVKVV